MHELFISSGCPGDDNKGLSVNRPLGITPDFEADLVARIEQNRRRSIAASRILRLRSGKSSPAPRGTDASAKVLFTDKP